MATFNIYHFTSLCYCVSLMEHENGFVYLFRSSLGCYKIGYSVNPERRIKEFSSLPFTVELICAIPADPPNLEYQLHYKYGDKKVAGTKEWFNLDEWDVDYIASLGDGVIHPNERFRRILPSIASFFEEKLSA